MPAKGLALEGLDGGTPLGFLASLGVLRALATEPNTQPTLHWELRNHWVPVLSNSGSMNVVVERLASDAAAWAESAVLNFRSPKVEKRGPKAVGNLKAPVAVYRHWVRDCLDRRDYEAMEYASALMTDLATTPIDDANVPTEAQIAQLGIHFEPGGALDRSTVPTFFDFTSRNAQFLEQVDAIRSSLDADQFRDCLEHGVPDPMAVSTTMDWDPSADAPGAIYSATVSGRRPAAEWLAFRGLAYFPVTGHGSTSYTTACRGRRKDGVFAWPIWNVPATHDTIRYLTRMPGLDKMGPAARRELGVTQVFRARLTKKADGYSGVFSPTEPV